MSAFRAHSFARPFVAIIVASTLVACSSSGSPSANGHAEHSFVATADDDCEYVLTQVAQTAFPVQSFDAQDPPVADLPKVGAYYDSIKFNHQEVGFIKSMGTPKQGRDTWSAFAGLIADEQALVAKQISTADASDKTGFVTTVNAIAALAKRIDTQALAVGFASTSYCIQLFG